MSLLVPRSTSTTHDARVHEFQMRVSRYSASDRHCRDNFNV
jgi:hypothetical protein